MKNQIKNIITKLSINELSKEEKEMINSIKETEQLILNFQESINSGNDFISKFKK